MEINEALEQLEEIRHHVNRSEVYRGYRSVLTAVVGLLALVEAFLQPRFAAPGQSLAFVYFWTTAAVLNILIPASSILFHFIVYESPLERRKTQQAIGQFLPALLAGAFITFAVCKTSESFIVFLPAIWSFLFGMGIYASKPYLPTAVHWVAASFFMGGVILLTQVPKGNSLSPWGVGLVFAFGMMAAALVLYFNIERKSHEVQK